MLTVDAYLLNGHKPSSNVGRIVDMYLSTCPGVVLRKIIINSRADLMSVYKKDGVKTLPTVDVPGQIVQRKRKRVLLTDAEEVEKWCKETVRQIDSANRRRR